MLDNIRHHRSLLSDNSSILTAATVSPREGYPELPVYPTIPPFIYI